MDKNSIIGIVLIFVVLIVFSVINQPSKQEIEAMRHRQDSIKQVEMLKQQHVTPEEIKENPPADSRPDTVIAAEQRKKIEDQLGIFSQAAVGEEKFYTIENNLLKLTFSNKGGKIYAVELKEYKTHDGKPLILFEGTENQFGLNFFANNRSIQTDQLYFSTQSPQSITVTGPDIKTGNEGNEKFNTDNPGKSETVTFRIDLSPVAFLEYNYTLGYNTYMVDFNIRTDGLNNYVPANQAYLNLLWTFNVRRQEKKSQYGEDRNTNVYFKFFEDEVDKLNASKSDEKNLSTRIKWIGMKQLFFNSTILADESFPVALVTLERMPDNTDYLGVFSSDISLEYSGKPSEKWDMGFFFGPNHFKTLRQYKTSLESQVNLGYSILRPVNRFLIIPVFDFLRKYIANMGIVILLLTIFIKLILFPFTYKSYISQAKMRVLKPEMDEINAKFGNEKQMEKQQATMDLYKKAGVNPMGGCLPMVLQMPILFAMFFFFPASIELRQQGFLWAHDLSTYDTILNLPFTIPFYGNHVSLFCLLMTITTVFSTWQSSQTTGSATMPGMKSMMYIMPVMFMFLLNSYASGLSYYYFLANVITIGQTYVVRSMVDENKIRAQIQLHKKKSPTKSKFQQRLEQIARERGIQTPAPKKK
jgi:YidC/Oxa1 family membrane protein insertase